MYNQHPGVTTSNNGYILYTPSSAVGPHRLLFRNNYWEKSGGLRIVGWDTVTASSRYQVLYNDVVNVQSAQTSSTTGYSTTTRSLQHRFSLLRDAQNLPLVEIGWNRVRNTWGDSATEDVISIYATGTDDDTNPYRAHHNLIQGAHGPVDSTGFSGGGIITDGTGSMTVSTVSRNIWIDDNIVLDSLNYGQKISQGYFNKLRNGIIIRDGIALGGFVYADTTAWNTNGWTTGSGLGVLNAQSQTWYGCHEVTGNQMGWLDPTSGGDMRNSNTPGCAVDPTTGPCADPASVCTGNTTPWTTAQLSAAKQTAIDDWVAAAAAGGFTIGPRVSASVRRRAGLIRL